MPSSGIQRRMKVHALGHFNWPRKCRDLTAKMCSDTAVEPVIISASSINAAKERALHCYYIMNVDIHKPQVRDGRNYLSYNDFHARGGGGAGGGGRASSTKKSSGKREAGEREASPLGTNFKEIIRNYEAKKLVV